MFVRVVALVFARNARAQERERERQRERERGREGGREGEGGRERMGRRESVLNGPYCPAYPLQPRHLWCIGKVPRERNALMLRSEERFVKERMPEGNFIHLSLVSIQWQGSTIPRGSSMAASVHTPEMCEEF